ncbi:MAG: helix-turn-helix transcriptional regulator, partial [Ktedonobacteraceae bacterium]
MPLLNWNQRFFESTRGRIITLLRRSSRTVEELAQALDLTDNAVRAHLATLERDGLVRQQGTRRGTGKPAFVYELTPETEQLFPKAYGSVLRELLHVLKE